MEKKLISVLTPCYNTGAYIHRLLDSILHQTWPAIEMYCIDDGSTDNTREVIEQYIPQFEAKRYSLHYVYQENSGQSVAINNALKWVKGDYLVWPDSDDFYATDNALERMVMALENSPKEFAMVRTQENALEDGSFVVMDILGRNAKEQADKSLFYDCLLSSNGFYFCSGAYMVDFKTLKEVIPNLDIYTDRRAGQNWQLLLPILWKYRCLTILEPLYNVVQRKQSHSRCKYISWEEKDVKLRMYETTLTETLHRMNMPKTDRERCLLMARRHFLIKRLQNAFEFHDKKAYDAIYNQSKSLGGLTWKKRLLRYAIFFYPAAFYDSLKRKR